MESFNLISDPWIPVRYLGGQHALVSLSDCFEQGKSIADLDVPPHERIALTRLLVCIAQAAHGAPEDKYGWDDFSPGLKDSALAYLARPDVAPHFNLFGSGPRFLQVEFDSDSEPVSASKLFPKLATGNNPTVLDHGATLDRVFSPESLALALLTFQCFYPLYGAGYKGRGPCVVSNMIHLLPGGANLADSILLACLDSKTAANAVGGIGFGRPIWESPLSEAVTRTYLGRLVPRHRDLWLLPGGKAFRLRQDSFEYPGFPACREPTSTAVVVGKREAEEVKLLSARLDKALWRDLHLMTILRKVDKGPGQCIPPVLLSHLPDHVEGRVKFWSGALVTDLKAKILDTVESSFASWTPWNPVLRFHTVFSKNKARPFTLPESPLLIASLRASALL